MRKRLRRKNPSNRQYISKLCVHPKSPKTALWLTIGNLSKTSLVWLILEQYLHPGIFCATAYAGVISVLVAMSIWLVNGPKKDNYGRVLWAVTSTVAATCLMHCPTKLLVAEVLDTSSSVDSKLICHKANRPVRSQFQWIWNKRMCWQPPDGLWFNSCAEMAQVPLFHYSCMQP